MKRSFMKFLFCVAGIVLCISLAYAEQQADSEKLTFTYGGAFRLRQEIWHNAFDLDTLTTPPAPTSVTSDRNFFVMPIVTPS